VEKRQTAPYVDGPPTAATLLRARYRCTLIFTGQLPHLF